MFPNSVWTYEKKDIAYSTPDKFWLDQEHIGAIKLMGTGMCQKMLHRYQPETFLHQYLYKNKLLTLHSFSKHHKC